jgi:hypothetical protein
MKNWIKNSNGWQRIGVVLSVLWILYAVISERKVQTDIAMDFLKTQLAYCASIATGMADCFQNVETRYDSLILIGWHQLEKIALYAFVPVILGWLLGLVSVKVYRWVSNGFKRKDL